MLRYVLMAALALSGIASLPAPALAAGARAAAKAASADGGARAAFKQATSLLAQGDYDAALDVIATGLAKAPNDLELLQLRASVLLETRDFEGALAAYETFLEAGAHGANKRAAEKIVANLRGAVTTFIHVKVTNGPAKVYLDSKSLGVFCVAGNECRRSMLPGNYKLIIEREGHEKLSERVNVTAGKVLEVERTLVEKPSAVSLASSPAGGQVVVDGKPLGATPVKVDMAPGEHALEIRLAGHATHRQVVAAHEGKPVDVDVTMLDAVPLAVSQPGAQVLMDGEPARVEDGAVVLPGPGAHVVIVRVARFREAKLEVPRERPEGYRLDVTLVPAPARLTVDDAPDGATVIVDGKPVGTVPLVAPIEVEAGPHTVEIQASGYAPYRGSARLDAASLQSVRMTHMQRTGHRKAWIAASAAGAVFVGSVVAGALAIDAQHSYDDLAVMPGVTASDPRLADYADRGNMWALTSDVSLGLAAVGGGLAAYWFFTEGKGESKAAFEPLVGPTGVGVSGRF